jgi:hypothetical protein
MCGGIIMTHEKTLKESIRNIISSIESPDGSEINIEEIQLERAVNKIDLLICTLLRTERLKKEKE